MAMLAGPGQGLAPPQALYPPLLYTTPFTAPSNQVELEAGQALLIPAGTWIVAGGAVSAVQWLDPVSEQWIDLNEVGTAFGLTIRSDGFNFRVANLSGSVTGATVTAPGTGYAQATTNVTPSAGNSTWQAVVGGSLGAATITAPGANFTIPPIVFVASPPAPGINALGHAVLTGGAVTGIVWDNPGAGYQTPPNVLLVPSPNDPALQTIQQAKATVVLATGAGATGVSAVLLKNAGAPQATAPTLTITGTGTGATATVLPATAVAEAGDTITIQPASGP
jgi:hypothetical protein